MAVSADVYRSELVGCLALATDLGMGQPLEHGLRTCRLAVKVGESLGLGNEELADAYYIALLRFVGCNAHARTDAQETGDEIAFRAGVAPVLNGGTPQMLRFMVANLGRAAPTRIARARMVAGALTEGPKGAREAIAATCEVGQMIAARLGMRPSVVEGLAYTYEHHDGGGYPAGAAGEQIPTASHLVTVARDFEVLYRMGGRKMVLDVASKRRGRAYNPRVLDGFLEASWEVLEAGESESGWDAVIASDPIPAVLSGSQLDDGLKCLADFSDVKSPFTHGYSHRVSELAMQAARAASMDGDEIKILGAAALVQELGMTAVSSAVVDKPGPLTDGEWERVRLHPYFTERILARCRGLAAIGSLAGSHHERIDGTGYHRGAMGYQLTPTSRLLSAAGAYVAMRSQRCWRTAMSAARAVTAIRELVAANWLDADAVDAVLAATGEPVVARRRRLPAGLTEREAQVLQLIARGKSNREVADALVISVKTVGRHIENIYAKTGVSTRAGATMFAVQHALAGPPAAPGD